jgi:hypothetical protein
LAGGDHLGNLAHGEVAPQSRRAQVCTKPFECLLYRVGQCQQQLVAGGDRSTPIVSGSVSSRSNQTGGRA